MKRTVMTIIAAVLLPLALNAQDLKVMSYNIRNSAADDGTNSWVYRYASTGDMIEDQKADVIGLQEAYSDQVDFIEKNFKDYRHADGFPRIMYNKKTVSVLKSGEAEGMAWALMKAKSTGKKFYVFNFDLQHTPEAERKDALAKKLEVISGLNTEDLPAVVTGGFCMKPADSRLADIETKMSNARKTAPKTDNTGTYNNWGKNSDIVDHIYYSGFSSCPEYQTVTKRYADRKFVSNHYPIIALLNF